VQGSQSWHIVGVWYRGLRLVDPKPFSNGKDKTTGGAIELTTRLEEIVSTRHQIPARPPIETEDPEDLQSLGVAIAQRQELMKEYKQQAVELQVKQEDLIKLYTPRASLVPWADVGPVQFPEPLTELQKKKSRKEPGLKRTARSLWHWGLSGM
jgi:hypothetical protein